MQIHNQKLKTYLDSTKEKSLFQSYKKNFNDIREKIIAFYSKLFVLYIVLYLFQNKFGASLRVKQIIQRTRKDFSNCDNY